MLPHVGVGSWIPNPKKPTPLQLLEGFLAVVPLVEDHGDVIAGLGQLPVMRGEFLDDRAELGAVVDIAGVNLMKQGDVEIGADQQAQADLAQIAALLFVMAPLRQFGGRAGVDVGEEVGAIVDQGAEIELKPLDEALSQLLFELADMFGADQIHVVPEVLRGKRSRIGGQEAGQDGLPVPVGELQFAGGADGAVNGREQQV